MSMNLTAHTKTGKKLELLQLNTNETFECLGFDGKGGYVNGKPPLWREVRDCYIKKVEIRLEAQDSEGKKWLLNHIHKLKCQPFLEFSYE